MIVRIMGEGQLDVPATELAALNALDAQVEAAVASGDPVAFGAALGRLLARVRQAGAPVPDDALVTSELVLPPADATVEEVRHLFDDGRDGLVPG